MAGDAKRRRTSMSLRDRTKRQESSVKDATPPAKESSPSPESKSASPEIEEPQEPTEYSGIGPLPSLPYLQNEKELLSKDYKSIAESGLLHIAFEKSRDKWLSGDLFQKYWIKPSKKRMVDENNPSKDLMTRMGDCTMVIHPHIFEVKLYSVRDKEKEAERERIFQEQQQRYQYQHAQYTQQVRQAQVHQNSPPGVAHPHTYTTAQSTPTQNYGSSQSKSITTSQPATSTVTNGSNYSTHKLDDMQHGSSSHQKIYPASTSSSALTPKPDHDRSPQRVLNQSTRVLPASQSQNTSNIAKTPNSVQSNSIRSTIPPSPSPAPDPVIQLLATKASADPELKALMRVVASGQATTDQLKLFQVQIDILTPLAEQAQAKAKANVARNMPSPSITQPGRASGSGVSSIPSRQQASSASQPQAMSPLKPSSKTNQQQAFHNTPNIQPTLPPKPLAPTVPRPKQLSAADRKHLDISAIVFEFSISTSGDRFLIPKYSLVEYRSAKSEMLLSFIHVDEATKLYQPITLRFNAVGSKLLEPFTRVLADPDVTRNHMLEVMKNYEKASTTYLVMRLRRENDNTRSADGIDQSGVKRSLEDNHTANDVRSASLVDDMTIPDPSSVTPTKIKRQSGTKLRTSKLKKASLITEIDASSKPKLKVPRSRKGRIADPTKTCYLCHTSTTSLWRKADIGDDHGVTLCNACGIKWKNSSSGGGSNRELKKQKQTADEKQEQDALNDAQIFKLYVPTDPPYSYRDANEVSKGVSSKEDSAVSASVSVPVHDTVKET